MTPTILAIDLGTTGNRALLFTKNGQLIDSEYQEFPQYFPQPAWVEHDPLDIWNSTVHVITTLLRRHQDKTVLGMGLTNQRETVVMWDKHTGQPLYNAIVWQCRRTADICTQLRPHAAEIKEKTGLFLDPYFSATKIKWLLDHVPNTHSLIQQNRLSVGTIDTWILYKLTEHRAHCTDPSNASRTMLYNIKNHDYDPDLLALFEIPRSILPEIKESKDHFGECTLFSGTIPILAVLGDQQSSLFAQGGFNKPQIKNTYGTGLFLMGSTQNTILPSENLISTVAWKIDKKVHYAVEGSIFIGGSAIQWIRDNLNLVAHADETDALAGTLNGNENVYFVPALAGLGCPYWDSSARGLLIGLTRQTSKEHIARAVLESLAYQTKDVIEDMAKIGLHTPTLRVDGGATKNTFLMQFQSDILNMTIEKPILKESTAFGIAGLTGMALDIWDYDTFQSYNTIEPVLSPKMNKKEAQKLYSKWQKAVQLSRGWA